MNKFGRSYVGVYGDVRIQKGYCSDCGSFAFVLEGVLQCCDRRYSEEAKRFKRECAPEEQRRLPPLEMRKRQIEAQDNKCIYCECTFGGYVTRNGRPVRVSLVWDHYVPFSYVQSNQGSNFVAACSICNGIKSDLIFQTLGEAIVYIVQKRTQKGFL